MTVQRRRRGILLDIWPQKTVVNRRGETVVVPDPDRARQVRAWISPDRSSRAEVPGQVGIEAIEVGIAASEDVGLWSRIVWDGREWDLVSPPAYHHGTRRTRHQTLTLRARSGGGHG